MRLLLFATTYTYETNILIIDITKLSSISCAARVVSVQGAKYLTIDVHLKSNNIVRYERFARTQAAQRWMWKLSRRVDEREKGKRTELGSELVKLERYVPYSERVLYMRVS